MLNCVRLNLWLVMALLVLSWSKTRKPWFRVTRPVVKTAEQFYTGLGFRSLPASFWTLSDLYPVQATDKRKKNTHASCWHVDLENDIRSLMSIEPNAWWFSTAHHELGHVYYFMGYTRPEVPPLLRDGANPGFHEGFGELTALAAAQVPYLKAIGLLPADFKADETRRTPLSDQEIHEATSCRISFSRNDTALIDWNAAIVFGPERAGLTNAELDLCQAILYIPANPVYSSLNLAMAVQLLAWELRSAQGIETSRPVIPFFARRSRAACARLHTYPASLEPSNP